MVELPRNKHSEDGEPLAQQGTGFRERPSIERGINKAVLLVVFSRRERDPWRNPGGRDKRAESCL